MSKRRPVDRAAVARVLGQVADSLDADQPDGVMTNAARLGRISLFTPGQPDLFDQALTVAPAVDPQVSRREYAAELRAVSV
jgi:hypothetical protein